MTGAELLCELNNRRALIVHLSHHAQMRDGGVFPDDLKNAIANCNQWPLSCVVVWPKHNMDMIGSIGVIFEPHSISNILSVSNSDSGSYFSTDEGDLSGGSLLSRDTFDLTFQVACGSYNEWRVQGAEVKGIFITDQKNLSAKKWQDNYCDGEIVDTSICCVEISLKEVFDTFPSLPVFRMGDNGPEEIPRPQRLL